MMRGPTTSPTSPARSTGTDDPALPTDGRTRPSGDVSRGIPGGTSMNRISAIGLGVASVVVGAAAGVGMSLTNIDTGTRDTVIGGAAGLAIIGAGLIYPTARKL